MQGLFEQECELALHARIQEETADKRNMLESYIYSLRNRLGGGDLAPFATEAAASSLLQQTEKLEVITLVTVVLTFAVVLARIHGKHLRLIQI